MSKLRLFIALISMIFIWRLLKFDNNVGYFASCETVYGTYITNGEIVYQCNNLRNKRDYYIISGGVYEYCSEEIETDHSPGVTQIMLTGCSMITGGENLVFQNSCIFIQPPIKRYRSMVKQFDSLF